MAENPNVVRNVKTDIRPDVPHQRPQLPDKPAPSVEPPTMRLPDEWLKEGRAFLEKYGWQLVAVNERGLSMWLDPQGTTSIYWTEDQVHELQLPTKDGGFETIKQRTCKPAKQAYTMDEAMLLQRERLQSVIEDEKRRKWREERDRRLREEAALKAEEKRKRLQGVT